MAVPGQEKALEKLEERVKTLSSLMSTVQVNMQKFSESMGKIAELASRLGFMLAMMGGLPRSMGHGNLAMMLFSGLGKSRFQRARSSGSGTLSHQQQVVAEAQRLAGIAAPPGAPRISAPSPSSIPVAKVADVEYEKKQVAEPIPVSVEEINAEEHDKNLATRSPLEALSMGTLSFMAKATKALQVQGLTPAARKNYSSGLGAVMERYGIDDSVSMKELHKQVIDELERRKGDVSLTPEASSKLINQVKQNIPSVPHSQSDLDKKHATTGLSEEEVKQKEAEDLAKLGIKKQDFLADESGSLYINVDKLSKAFRKAKASTAEFLSTFNKDFFSKFVGMDPEDFASLGKGKKTQAFITEAARRAAGTFITTSSAGAAALQTGAPDAFGTLKGSVALVAAQFGQMLVPAAVDLSRWLQNIAKWFEELSPGVKSVVSEIFKWTLVVTAGSVALGKLVPVLNLLTGAVALLYKGLNAGGWLGSATKLGLFAAALGVVTYAAVSLANSFAKASEAKRESIRKEVDDAHEKARERVSQDEATKLNYSDAVKTQLGLKNSTSMQGVDDFVKSNFDFSIGRLHALKKARLTDAAGYRDWAVDAKKEAEKDYGTGALSRGLQMLNPADREGIAMYQNRIADFSKREAGQIRESNVIQRLIDMLEGKQPLEKVPAGQMTDNQKALLDKRSGNMQQLMFSMSGLKATPQYNTIDELYKKINLSAVGQDPIEREMLRIQLKAQELFIEKMIKDEENGEVIQGLLKEQLEVLRASGIFK